MVLAHLTLWEVRKINILPILRLTYVYFSIMQCKTETAVNVTSNIPVHKIKYLVPISWRKPTHRLQLLQVSVWLFVHCINCTIPILVALWNTAKNYFDKNNMPIICTAQKPIYSNLLCLNPYYVSILAFFILKRASRCDNDCLEKLMR